MKLPLASQFIKDLNQNIGIVHRVCKSYFMYDLAERQDVFQEIMFQLWKSYPNFHGDSKFSTWMYKVALNTAITHVRKSKVAPGKAELTEAIHYPAESNDPTDTDEKIRLLYAGISTLTSIDKAIVLLHLEENTYDEIADITGLTKTNVSVRLVRIRKTLEQKLKLTN